MPYVNRFLTNANGAITFTGNTFGLNKQANANAPGTAGSIGTFFSVNPTSVDGSFPTGTTANYLQNSSSAILRLPSTTTQILYAELIWGGSYLYGGEDVSSALNNAVTFITPSRTVSVQSDTATRFTLTSSSFYYVRSANVTNLISQAGTYSVLGVPGTQSTTENNANAAGWTLAVVYADPLQKSRNLSIFVGAELTSSATGSSTAAVSGFGTPITGTVNGRLLVSAIEGDSAIVGDQLQFGPTTASLQPVSGPNNPINNFFASQINNDSGALDTSGQFGSLNSTPGGSLSGARQGWDITNIDVSARLSNNQTSAVVRGTTNGDTYVISALALQVDINAPVLNVSKSANVTSARTGDIITYTVQVSNTGTAAANVLIATDPLSSATTFIPNSLQVDGVTQTNVDIRNGLPLGTLNINQTRVLTYQVRVVGPLTSISSLGNQVFINYQFESTPGNVLTGSGASPVNSVTAINTPPTVPNYTITNPEDTVAIGTVIGNDIDGNPLTYRIGTRPTNGIVTVNPNGQFVYTPNLNFNGTDQFTVIVDDGQGGTATSIVTIINTPVNDNPVTQNYAVITNEDTPLVGQIQATDVDGDSLTFQLQSPPTNGTVTVTNSGSYVYTPNLNFNGTDQFTVLVSDGHGGTAVSTVTVTVTPVNDAPTVPNYTFSTQEDSPVVGAIVGTDVDGNPLSYQLQNRPTNGIAVVNANGTFSYQPNLNFNGSDQFTVLVSDGQGGTAVSAVTINVIPVNDPPITSNVSFTIAEDSTLINRVVAVDPDGDPLTFSLQTAPGNGVAVVNANGTFSYQPNLNFNGTDQFTVLVSDGHGGTAVSTVTVTVTPVNDAPTVPNYTFSTQEDRPVVGAIVGTDVDGNPLSYQLQNRPTNGIAVVNANGTFSYQPNLNFNGSDQFTVLVSDGQGGTAVSTVTINVIPVNDPPITSNVSFTIAEDSTLINQIVAVDPDGDPLTFSLQAAPGNGVAVVNADGTFSYQPNLNFNGTDQFTVLVSDGQGGTAVSTVTVTVTPVNDAPTVPNYTFSTQEDSSVVGAVVGIDVDGNPLSYQLQLAPTNGVAAVNANGTFSYQPNLNFNGSDQFTVLVSDDQGGTAVSTVTINVIPVNDPPITSNVSFTIAEDSTLINQIVAVDPDGDPLTFSLQAAPGNGVAVVNADGTFSYQPNLNFNGTDQFTVLVSDGQGGTAVSTVTVTVTPVNDAPTVPNYTFSTQEDSPVVGAIVGTDVDGNPLSYQLQNRPTNGIAVVNANGTFSYQPNLNFNGTDQFTVLVSDGQGGTAISTVTINVIPVNDPPITSNVSFTIAEDSTLINQIVAVDPDGDPLTFSLQAAPGNGVAVVNADGTFSYQPNLNFNGTDQFTVLVSDGHGGTAVSTVTVIVTPVNDAPTVPNYTFSTQEDSSVVGAVVGIDVDGNPLSYQLQVAPTDGVAAVNANGTFSYQPNLNFNGTDQFTVLVSDGQGGTAVSTVTINVIPVNDPPITSNVSFTIAEDSTLINQIVAVDPDGDPLTFSLQAAPGNGVAVVNADGTFSYQPNLNFNGTDQFTVLVSDGHGGTAVSTVTVIVTPVNDAPTVPNYTFSTQEDSPVVGAVVGIDVDGNPLSYQLQNPPTNGVAVVNPDGTFSYQPNANFNGTNQFTVLVSDGQGGTAVSTVTINVIPVNDPPITSNVSFTIAEDSTLINQIVAVDPDGDPLTFSLQAAPGNGVAVVNVDGAFSYQPNPNFNGTDRFTVLVSDGQGGTAVSTVTVIVTPVNDAPTVPNYTFSTQEDSPVIGAIVGTDVDGNPLSYQLQVAPTNGVAAVNADGTFSYQPNPNFNGTDQFTVLVSDGQGGTAVSTVTINVIPVNDPPITSNVSFTIAEDSTLINQIVAVDPDGDSLTFSLQAAPGNGVVVVNVDGTFSYQPNLNFNGTDRFTVLVSDGQGGTAVSTVTVIVTPVNDAPTVPNYTFSTQEDSPIIGAIVGTDVDGNPLSYQLQVAPINGVAAVNTDGTFSYQPDLNFNGSDQFTVLVSDGQGGTAVSTVTINVIPVNDPPITADLAFTINEDTPLTNQIPAFDPDGDLLTFTLLNPPPSNGSVVLGANGVFTYTPNLNYNGTDTFSVLVSDGQGGSSLSTVTLTIVPVNDPPIGGDRAVTTTINLPVTSSIPASDPDDITLTYTLQQIPANGSAIVNQDGIFTYIPNNNFVGNDQFTILITDLEGATALSNIFVTVLQTNGSTTTQDLQISTNEDTPVTNQVIATNVNGNPLIYTIENLPINGVVTIDSNTGIFTYTPNTDFYGSDAFVVYITDNLGGNATSSVIVTVAPINDSPIVPNYQLTTNEDTSVTSMVIATDSDSNQLTYSLQNAPVNGTVDVGINGMYTYTPNADFNGIDQFTVVVSDEQGGTAVSTITITVLPVNDPPVGPVVVTLVTNEDTPVSSQITAFDPDGEVLTYTLQDPPTNGVAVVNADGTFTYTPNGNYNGPDTFTVLIISDPSGAFIVTSVFVTVTPVNDVPVVPNYEFVINEDTTLNSQVVATDVDGNPLTYGVLTGPVNGTVVVNPDGTYTYTPNENYNGIDSFSVVVSDGQGGTAVSTITITILPVNDPPVGPVVVTLVTNEDTPVSSQITAFDPDGEVLTYTLQDPPTNGVAVVNADGIFTYTPNGNYNGPDTFTVLISDPSGAFIVTSVFVTVTPVNDVPVVPNYEFVINEDTTLNSQVVATDIDGNPLTYALLTGPVNGTVVVNPDGTYTYTPNENYNGVDSFSVVVSDGQGGTAVSTITITILPVNDPPVGPVVVTLVTDEDTPVSSQITAFDPDGEVLTYTLQDPPTNGVAVVNADGTFTYTPNGNYNGPDTFTVLISDPSGAFIVTSVFVTVTPVNDVPVVPNYEFVINEDTTLNSQVVATDVDGRPLTYGLLTGPVNGTVIVNPDGTYTYTPNENYNGIDSFSVVVSDGQGGTAVSTITITILPVNDPPVGPVVVTLVTDEDTPVSSQITAFDPDGEVLTYTLQDPPTNGVAVVNADGTFTYTPNGNYNGPDTFTVLISDPSGAFIVTSVFVTVTPVNDVPVVPNYEFVINEDTTLNSQVVATDIDGNPLTYALLTGPVNGTVVVNPDGTYTYTPNENYNGVDSFSVVVSDGQGGTAVSTITITILPINDPPVGPVVVTLVTDEDTPVSSQITAFDPDGEVLTYTLQDPPTNGVAVVNADGTFTYTPNGNYNGPDTFTVLISDPSGAFIVTSVFVTVTPVNDVPVVPNYEFIINEDTTLNSQVVATDVDGRPLTYGLLTGPVNGTVVVNPDGTYTYTPNENYNGIDSFSVVVSDGQGETAVSTITITVLPVNDPPVGPVVVALVTNEDTPVSSQITAFDPDGEVLTYTLQDPPTNGVAVVNADGTFTYTPNGNYNGPDTFTVLISDPSGAFIVTSVFVTVTPVNDVPVVPNYEFVINEDTTLNSQVVATDVDGNPLTYGLLTGPVNGTVIVNPDGTYTYTPNENYNGIDSFSVVVSDGQGETAVSTITITILPVNDPPVGPVVVTLVTNEDTPVSSQITAFDPDGEVLTYTLQDPPTNGVAVVNADGTFTYTPNENYNGPDTFTVLISDPSGAFIVTSVFVTVTPVNDVPVVPNYEFIINEDTTLNSQVVATDVDGRPLTYGLLTSPVNGTVVVNPDGTYTYTPNENYNGIDSFSVVVSDGQGETAVSTITITVLPINDPPVGPDVITVTTLEEIPVTGQIVATDPDGDPLMYTLQDLPANGTAIINQEGLFTYIPNENFAGNDTFTVSIADSTGQFIITNVFVVVIPVEQPPTVPNYSITTPENQSVTSQVVGTDPHGDPLTYRLGTSPVNGNVIVNADGSFVYLPNSNYVGPDLFTVIVEDSTGLTAVSIVNVTVIDMNDSPVTSDVILQTIENVAINGQVFATDPDDNLLTFSLSGTPFNGTAVVNADGTFLYTPNLNFIGLDSFTVEVRDSRGASAQSLVTISVIRVNQPPLVIDLSISTVQGQFVTGQIPAFDPEGDPLVYGLSLAPLNGTAIINADGTFTYTPNPSFVGSDSFSVFARDALGNQGFGTITVEVQSQDLPISAEGLTLTTLANQPVSGSIATVNPAGFPLSYAVAISPSNGTVVLNQDGALVYTPNPGFTGEDVFSIVVRDSAGNQSIANAVVTVVVGDRISVVNSEITTLFNAPVSGQISATNLSGNQLFYTLTSNPINGSVLVNPDGTFSYTPNAGFFGTDQFQVLVSDVLGNTAVATVSIVTEGPVERAPIVSDQTLTTIEEQPVSGAVQAVDPQGEALTYTLLGTPPNGIVVLNPDGTFTYTPNSGFVGTESFTVAVQNQTGLNATATIQVTVTPLVNQIIVTNTTVRTEENQSVNDQVSARDQLNRPLTYTLNTPPLYGTAIVNQDGTFIYTPTPGVSGIDQFDVLIQNNQGDQAIAPVIVIINPAQSTITLEDVTVQTQQNVSVSGTVIATDSLGRPLRFSLNLPPLNGTVRINPDGTFTYTPSPQFFGIDSFTVLVQNDRGNSAIGIVRVVVQENQDIITVTPLTVRGQANQPVTGQVTATDTLGRPLTYQVNNLPSNGTIVFNANGTFIYTPNMGFTGIDSFTVLVQNDLGQFATSSVNVVVEGINNTISTQDQELTIPTGQIIGSQIIAVDALGRPLTYTVVTPPANGVVILNIDGTFTYTSNLGFVGQDQFVVVVRNDTGQEAFSVVTVNSTPSNNIITPGSNTFTTLQGIQVIDSVQATNLLQRPLNYTLTTEPANGNATLDASGRFVYQPNSGFIGTDSFTVLVRDDLGTDSIVLVTIIVGRLPQPPIIAAQTFRLLVNTIATGRIIATDPNSLQLFYQVTQNPQNGQLLVDRITGEFIYVPNPNFVGTDTAVVRVTNTDGVSSEATVTFTVERAPTPTPPISRPVNNLRKRKRLKKKKRKQKNDCSKTKKEKSQDDCSETKKEKSRDECSKKRKK
ncbi:tandem-95 repeat protein [Priestia megaterium]